MYYIIVNNDQIEKISAGRKKEEELKLDLYTQKRDCQAAQNDDQVIFGIEFTEPLEVAKAINIGVAKDIQLRGTRDDYLFGAIHCVTLPKTDTHTELLNYTVREIYHSKKGTYQCNEENMSDIISQLTNAAQLNNETPAIKKMEPLYNFYLMPAQYSPFLFTQKKNGADFLYSVKKAFNFWFDPDQLLSAAYHLTDSIDRYPSDEDHKQTLKAALKTNLECLWRTENNQIRYSHCREVQGLLDSINHLLSIQSNEILNKLKSNLMLIRDSFNTHVDPVRNNKVYMSNIETFAANIQPHKTAQIKLH